MTAQSLPGDLKNALDARVEQLFGVAGNCAQTSFLVLQEHFGVNCDVDSTIKGLSPFPGVGLTFETCGAVSGCLFALGLALAPSDRSENHKSQICKRSASEFCKAVSDELNSTRCGALMESHIGRRFDLANAQEWADYKSSDGPKKCCEIVKILVQLASRAIARARQDM